MQLQLDIAHRVCQVPADVAALVFCFLIFLI
jgi:hypothetical protein